MSTSSRENSPPDPRTEAASDRLTMRVRVRYSECDPMRLAHHSMYAVWFEMARTEQLRQRGVCYRDIEDQGWYLVVARLSTRFRKPARYDDELDIEVRLATISEAKIEHTYEVRRSGELLTTGQTTVACVDSEGHLMRVPREILG
jgi:acyl-CoA thioester hydrolase